MQWVNLVTKLPIITKKITLFTKIIWIPEKSFRTFASTMVIASFTLSVTSAGFCIANVFTFLVETWLMTWASRVHYAFGATFYTQKFVKYGCNKRTYDFHYCLLCKKDNLTSLTELVWVSHISTPTFANTVVILSVTFSVTSTCSEETRIFTFSIYTFLIVGTFAGVKVAFVVRRYRWI